MVMPPEPAPRRTILKALEDLGVEVVDAARQIVNRIGTSEGGFAALATANGATNFVGNEWQQVIPLLGALLYAAHRRWSKDRHGIAV